MTYSNGQFNPNPFANPFNTRLGPSNYSLNPNGVSFRTRTMTINPNAKLPEAVPYGEQTTEQDRLTVPNQLDSPPIGLTVPDFTAMRDNVVCLPDGSILDYNTGKMIKTADQNTNIRLANDNIESEWVDNHGIPTLTSSTSDTIDAKSNEYWKNANSKAEELVKNLDDEQKEMLDTLNEFGF